MRMVSSRIMSRRSSAAGLCACRSKVSRCVTSCTLMISRGLAAHSSTLMTRGLYNLGGGPRNALSLREIIDRIAEIIQCNPVFDEAAPLPTPVPLNYVTDLTRVREELNWEPQIGIEEGLKSLI